MRRPGRRLEIVRRECRSREGRKKLRRRMQQRGFCTPSFARDLVEAAAVEVMSDPAGSLELSRCGVQIARRSGDPCCEAKAVAILAGARLLTGEFERAEKTLGTAFAMAADCPCCQPLLQRTHAYLHIYQGRHALAVESASRAVVAAKARVDRGRSLHCRAIAYDYHGRGREALADIEAAIRELPPDDPRYGSALHSFALILARLGDPASARRAAALLPRIEKSFKGKRGLSVERAKLAWLAGEVARAAGDPALALKHLERARNVFVRLRMPIELIALCADIGTLEMARPWPREKVRRLLEATSRAAVAAEMIFPAALRRPLARVEQATRAQLDDLRGALEALRQATVELGCPPPIPASS